LRKRPDLVVLMASTLTRRNAEISLRALALGAADYVPKPESRYDPASVESFRHDLIEKIRALTLRRRRRGGAAAVRPTAPVAPPPRLVGESAPPVLRATSAVPPRALVIGASTGGPQALDAILAHVGTVVDQVPVLITQHMPPTFTTILAEHLSRLSRRPTREVVDGMPIQPGTIHLARGGHHMCVARRSGTPVIELDDGAPVNFCKPAVDLLFSSAAEVWGAGVLALVLTGMGRDGSRGAADIVRAGGSVIVQDDATSVVWGMPGSVAQAGLASAVLPLDRIAPHLVSVFRGGKL
jgi:two-component system chemotaxis response regulator CheB